MAVVINGVINANDTDNTNFVSATVSITGNFVSGQDVLSFTNQNGITGSYNATSGVMTLTGSATVANYQTALHSVRYSNSSDNPSASPRTVSFVVNDGSVNSNTITSTVNVAAVNDAPTVTNSTISSIGANVSTTITTFNISDVDAGSNNITATISATGGIFTVLSSVVGGTITNNGTSSVTLTGSQTAIDAAFAAGVTYTAPSTSGSYTMTIVGNDQGFSGSGGTLSSTSNRTFTVVPSFSISAVSANENAGTMTFTVTKTGAGAATVQYATANSGTGALYATAGTDYTAPVALYHFLVVILHAAVSAAGDFNGDGYQDLIIGARGVGSNGEATLIFGGNSLASTTINASTLTGTSGANAHGFNFVGDATNDNMGTAVSGIGDFNGDGLSDVIITSSTSDSAFILEGQTIMSGGSFNASNIGGSLHGLTITAPTGGSIGAVSGAGDFNGDGLSDVLIGFDTGSGNASVYLVFGTTSTSTIALQSFTSGQGYLFTGLDAPPTLTSHWVTGLGDVNGDGLDDIMLGDPNADTNANNAGSSYLIYGFNPNITQIVTGSNQTINGTTSSINVIQDAVGSNNIINGGTVNDILIGGHADILNGLAGNDTLRGSIGNLTLNGGQGDDILWGGHGNNTFGYNLATDGHSNDVVHGTTALNSWVDTIDLSSFTQGPSATLGGAGSWTLVVEGTTMTFAAASGSFTFANHDQAGVIQIHDTADTTETIRFTDIEKVQWHA